MSRKIKFRAWDKKMKRFINMNDCNTRIRDINNTNSCEFMQYTGLKDKNGVEIYEGDVVHNQEVGFMTVSYSESNGCHTLTGEYHKLHEVAPETFDYYLYSTGLELTVIGNIHQNPELLEQSND